MTSELNPERRDAAAFPAERGSTRLRLSPCFSRSTSDGVRTIDVGGDRRSGSVGNARVCRHRTTRPPRYPDAGEPPGGSEFHHRPGERAYESEDPEPTGGPDQITSRAPFHARHRDRRDLVDRSIRARWTASRASVLTRSPLGRCSFDGATTSHRIPDAFKDRCRPNPVGPSSLATATGPGRSPARIGCARKPGSACRRLRVVGRASSARPARAVSSPSAPPASRRSGTLCATAITG